MSREAIFKELDDIITRYPVKEAALLPALHLVQRKEGFISDEAMKEIASYLDIPPIRVERVMTFYTMFRRKPVGRYFIEVCTNISCSLLGASHVVTYLEQLLGIKVGETTADGLFTLSTVECLGSCGTAPMMQINDDYYENLTREKIKSIIDHLKEKAKE